MNNHEQAAQALATVVPLGHSPQAEELQMAVALEVSQRSHPSNIKRTPPELHVCPTCGGLGRVPGGDT